MWTWTFGHAVREIERTDHQVVVEETATAGAIWMFGVFAVLAIVISRHWFEFVITLFLAGLAFYASINSMFVADRKLGTLIVRRRIWKFTLPKKYAAHDIDRVYVQRTIKESALCLRFRSGRTKSLTMSLGFADPLDDIAAVLNEVLYVPQR